MRIALLAMSTSLIVAGIAYADFDKTNLPEYFGALTAGTWPGGGDVDGPAPRFVFTPSGAVIAPDGASDAASPLSEFGGPEGPAVIGKAGDGKAQWLAVDLTYFFPCGMEGCDKMIAPRVHGAALFDGAGNAVAWSVGLVVAGSFEPRKPSPRIQPVKLAALPTRIDAGATDAVAAFKAAIADPEALAKAIADRKDVVLYGSELPERYVGAAAVRATLRHWKLGFTIHDGIQAGVTPSKTTAWVAANVDAAKKGSKKSMPYRVFAVLDKHGAAWQVVLLHFSVATAKRD